jgi:KDO2-lipid IV(A) lauroyltransferase
LLQSGVCDDPARLAKLLRRCTFEAGKAVAEVPAMWFRPQLESTSWIRNAEGLDLIANARTLGKGIIVLTPHLGCFELLAQYYALNNPITVLYRPPHFAPLEPAMRAGRTRPNIRLATTDVSGVRQLLKALHKGESIGVLPDQVPGAGDGAWADFFGRPAYTMTLWSRLAERSKAAVIMAYARRLPGGAGFDVHFESMPPREPGETPARHLNRSLENIIRRFPEQYLWAYNRYKVPAGAQGPSAAPATDESVEKPTGINS